MQSIGKVLDRYRGVGPGFNTLRLVLSVSVLFWHSILVSYGNDEWLWARPETAPASAFLPMFFALSGFLVLGSAMRAGRLLNFVILRGVRVFPALAVEITLSALLLGPLVTTHPLSGYFTDPAFFKYFGSMIGRVRFTLPGVFEGNPFPNVVNASLWTIPVELLCYVFIAVLIVTQVYRHRTAFSLLVVALTLGFAGHDLVVNLQTWQMGPRPQFLLISFAFGNLIYLWRDRIPHNRVVFFVCLAIGLTCSRVAGVCYLSFLCDAYCIVFLGLTPMPKIPVLSNGDYSYGIYLYAFPVQQAMIYLFPQSHQWYWNILLSLPVVIGVAMLSSMFIERPALSLRKVLKPKKVESAESQSNYVVKWLVLTLLFGYALYLCVAAAVFNITAADLGPKITVIIELGAVAAVVALSTFVLERLRATRRARLTARDAAAGEATIRPQGAHEIGGA